MYSVSRIATIISLSLAFAGSAFSEGDKQVAQPKPYRTFISIQKYTIENNGETNQPVSNVRLELTFPNGNKVKLPENGEHWVIGNGQYQEINRTFELPYAFIQKDGFKFQIQMVRKGSKMLPCEFDVVSLSQFNRSYICHTDINAQTNKKVAEANLDKEGVQIRVFTDLNSQPNEIPQNSIALR